MDARSFEPIYVFGYPGELGGAATELWHTLRLWREAGLGVVCIPTWSAPESWRKRVSAIGCRTLSLEPGELAECSELRQKTVVAFCNRVFLQQASVLRRLGCRLVWAGCMNWLFPAEYAHYRRYGAFDAYVFQSRYQHRKLVRQLARFGVSLRKCHRIAGAFFADEYPFQFRPHGRGEVLVLGRVSRADPAKFAPDSWQVYPTCGVPLKLRILGWGPQVESRLGAPPAWAECLPPLGEPVPEFLRSLHVLTPLTGGAIENWPRVGLEAMAGGVPIVVENLGGWSEMILPGKTGYLVENRRQWAEAVRRLAADDEHRHQLAQAAREYLQVELADPERIWPRWQQLFEGLWRR